VLADAERDIRGAARTYDYAVERRARFVRGIEERAAEQAKREAEAKAYAEYLRKCEEAGEDNPFLIELHWERRK
jgi:hypothetical protein